MRLVFIITNVSSNIKNRQVSPFMLPVLMAVVLFGFYVRIGGISFGLPDLIHPDEGRIILDTMSMAQRMSPIPEDINYPLFHKYILLVTYGFYFLTGTILGFFKDKTDFAVKFLQDPSSIIYLSRVVMSVLGTSTIVVAYYWGKLIDKSKITGLLASLFVALEWQLVFESQYAVHQTLAALSSLIAFLGMSLMCIRKDKYAYIVGGLTMGFAVASHQTTVLLFPGVLYLLTTDIRQKNTSRSEMLKKWSIYCLGALAIGILGNLNWIFRFERSMNFFLQGSGAGKVAFSSAPYFSYNLPSITYWYFSEIIRRDYFLGVMVLVASLLAMVRRKRTDVLYLIITLTYLTFFYKWTYRWIHLFVGLLPISMVVAAQELARIGRTIKIRQAAIYVFLLVLIIPNIKAVLAADFHKQQPETRQLARTWIIENIPKNSKIAVDYPAYAVSLPSEYPSMLRNRIARTYFDSVVPAEVRNMFLFQTSGSLRYDVVDMIDSRTDPVWPKNMPLEAIEKASKSATMRDVYAYFNFKPLQQLVDEGVNYIVINSYTYGMALTNDDPRKRFLMNYYLIDDVSPFAYNTDSIAKNTQHELLFYMVKREREYFLPLLNNEISNISLIKEFYPQKNLGPVVKIYKIN